MFFFFVEVFGEQQSMSRTAVFPPISSAPMSLSGLMVCSCLPVAVQITTDLYEADLEKALILSKLEFEQKQVNELHTSMVVFIFVINDN